MSCKRLFLILIILLVRCSKPSVEESEVWKVNEISSENFPVKPGMVVSFSDKTMTFSGGNVTVYFDYITTDDRLVLGKGSTKWLFIKMKTNDSAMVWKELYSDQPLIIYLKMNNHKK